ncbi:hypothetical protein [Microbacterium sp.]|uniref:hypothetical protein n=1 Tax=Microbacterium sp. TaxID=51671 RepID=UPI0035B287B6
MALALALTGCGPGPDIDPTPTFSSEAEAFAAAEATYRAYVDALNEVDLSDPETFEGVYSWTTGEANAVDRQTLSEMHANGWVVDGPTSIALIELNEASRFGPAADIVISVCLDVSAVTLVDEGGDSVVAADRPDVQSMRIDLVPMSHSPTRMAISRIDGREGDPSCDA